MKRFILAVNENEIAVVTTVKDINPKPLAPSTNPEFLAIIQNEQQELKAGKKLLPKEMETENL